MRPSKRPITSYLIIIASLMLVVVIIYRQQHDSYPQKTPASVNPDAPAINNSPPPTKNILTDQLSKIRPPAAPKNKDLSTSTTPTLTANKHDTPPSPTPLHIVPSLTLGQLPANSSTSQTNSILRQKYLAAVRSGHWPEPTTPTHQKLKTLPPANKLTTTSSEILHIVQKGESLSSISKKYYNDPNKWRIIYTTNRNTIGSKPNLLHAGQRLVIPPLGD